jgi:hypothetical protein
MTRRCILHIGLHKTGSSAIQHSFQRYDDGRLAYLQMGVPNHSYWCNLLFPGDRLEGFLRQGYASDAADFARRAMEVSARVRVTIASTDRDLIISAEGLSNIGEPETVWKVREFLEPFFDEIKVVGYVRPPAAQIVSSFQEILKRQPVDLDPGRLYPGFKRKLAPWDEVFGRENVEFHLFDRAKLRQGDVALDFAWRVGADAARITSKHVNESMSAEGLAILFKLRSGMEERSRVRQTKIGAMLPAIQTFGDSPFHFSPEIVQRDFARHIGDITWMEQRLGCSFPPYRPKPGSILFSSNDDLLDYAAVLAPSFSRHLLRFRLKAPFRLLGNKISGFTRSRVANSKPPAGA